MSGSVEVGKLADLVLWSKMMMYNLSLYGMNLFTIMMCVMMFR